MRNLCTTILTGPNASNADSSIIDAGQLVSASFHLYFTTGDVDGSIKIQASNDPTAFGGPNGPQNSPSNWVDIPNATASITSGESAIITIPVMTYRWVKAVYTCASPGGGLVVINMNALST